jgi:hypothetical protein
MSSGSDYLLPILLFNAPAARLGGALRTSLPLRAERWIALQNG